MSARGPTKTFSSRRPYERMQVHRLKSHTHSPGVFPRLNAPSAAARYRGKHYLVLGAAGAAGAAEQRAARVIAASQRALSVRLVAEPFASFAARFSFLCEPTARSAAEEHQQLRARRLHLYPAMVLPRLFLGGVESAEDRKVASDLGLTHVLTITADPHAVDVPPWCERLQLTLRDEKDEDIAQFFDTTFEFLSEALERGGRVLVHCKMGRSRSATLVLMFLVRSGRMSLSQAWQDVKACRRQLAINKGFGLQLIDFETRQCGCSTVSWDHFKGLRFL